MNPTNPTRSDMTIPRTCPAFPPLESMPFIEDRTAGWRMWREAGDVAVTDNGVYYISAADAVDSALKNTQLFSSEGAYSVLGSPLPLVPIAFDPPQHTRYRRLLDKFFSPRAMAAREARLREEVGLLIDDIVSTGDTCEVVSQLAVPFPATVFLSLFGLPLADRDRLIGWKDAILKFSDPSTAEATPEVLAQAGELFVYLSGYVEERRKEPRGDDLLSELITDEDEGLLTNEEILGLCFLFVIAGLDTVTSATGFVLDALAADPILRGRVLKEEGALAIFVEEVLRIDPPAPAVLRKTTSETEVDGVVIPEGSLCWLALGAADRDPRQFEHPDTISIDEKPAPSFAFGRGPHRCLGSHLARLELRLIVEEWHKRIPEYSHAARAELRWPAGTMGLERLELKIGQS